MSKISILIIAAGCLLTAGCAVTTAQMMAKPGGPYAPTTGSDFGLVRYLADGSVSDIQMRQQDANRQMYDACGGHYRILSQGARSQLNMSPSGGRFMRGTSASSKNYVYIKFVCTRK
ncbi:MAG: hypothetical protein ACRETA_07715 [Gammaproteobacteria bacterium]